ncbi:MAG: sulfite exporter TauE/SafE family protein [Armatimonadetes bacterium]|jgi:uncharacterized membrane protein YfcA|nr:sulfite exporter TauE/SafE family protein [Armatimonadota bacterium]
MFEFLKKKTRYRTAVILVSIGLFSGALGGLLGLGGGAFVVPALVFFLAFDQHRAHGTSLAIVLAMSISGVIVYSFHHYIDLLLALEIAIGGIAGALVGGGIVNRIKSRVLRRMFSIFLLAAGIKMSVDGYKMLHYVLLDGGHTTTALAATQGAGILLALGAGVLTGFLSSLLGVGGGIVMVPMLTMMLHLPQQQAQGISLAAMMPIAFTGMLKHHSLGNVDLRVAKWASLGAVTGAIVGASIANCLDPGRLKIAFGVFVVAMAAFMAAKRK